MTVERTPPPGATHQQMIDLLNKIRERERADPPPEDKTGEEWLAWVKRRIDAGAACTMPDWA